MSSHTLCFHSGQFSVPFSLVDHLLDKLSEHHTQLLIVFFFFYGIILFGMLLLFSCQTLSLDRESLVMW